MSYPPPLTYSSLFRSCMWGVEGKTRTHAQVTNGGNNGGNCGGGKSKANKRLHCSQVTQAGSSCSLQLLAAVPLQLYLHACLKLTCRSSSTCLQLCYFNFNAIILARLQLRCLRPVNSNFRRVWVFNNSSAATYTGPFTFRVFSWGGFQLWRNI